MSPPTPQTPTTQTVAPPQSSAASNGTQGNGTADATKGAPAQIASSSFSGWSLPRPPVKQKMATGLKSLFESAKKLAIGDDGSSGPGPAAPVDRLFPRTDPAVDGDDCVHDCESCTIRYPKGFKIDESDVLYGHVKGWSTHVLVATGKSDWVRDVADEKGSVMQAIDKCERPANGRLMLSASNMPTPHHTSDYSEPTTVLLLPAFTVVGNVTPATVPTLMSEYVGASPTTSSPLTLVSMPRSASHPRLGADLPEPAPAGLKTLTSRPSPHRALVLLCSQRTRDARCGQSAPLLRRELERHLRPLGLYRDLDDERPGGVGIYFISHVGGHKYSANVMVYRRPDAFGLDGVERAGRTDGEILRLLAEARKGKAVGEKAKSKTAAAATPASTADDGAKGAEAGGNEGAAGGGAEGDGDGDDDGGDVGAGQCIWLARVAPQDCENLVRYTILQGKVVKPETQLRGGFDRQKGLLSW